jgi:hypothetical protein
MLGDGADERARHRTQILALGVFALLLFVFAHLRGFSVTAFSDDVALVRLMTQRVQDGSLSAELLSRVTGAMAVGGTMWRPLPYASFGLDALMHGDAVSSWRVVNVLFHVAAALAVASIVRALALPALSATIAFGVFLLQPWAPEVSIWLVGRYDAFATFFIVCSLALAARSTGWDRRLFASLLTAAFAYASKESASTLVAMLLLVLVVRDRRVLGVEGVHVSTATAKILSTHVVLLLAFLLLRQGLFETISVDLYRSGLPSFDPFKFFAAFVGHITIARSMANLSPVASVVSIVAFSAALVVALLRRESRWVAMLGLGLIAIVAGALALVFPSPDGSADGWRVYHLMSFGIAIVAAAAFAASGKAQTLLVLVSFVALGVWQRAAVEEWRGASNAMVRLQSEIKRLGDSLPSHEYGLVVAPDRIGRVPFARNANGGLLLAYSGDRERISQMIITTDAGVWEWLALSNEGVVKKLTMRADVPAAPTQFYCFNGQSLVPLGFWKSPDIADWQRRWASAFGGHCSSLTYRK